MQWDYFLRIMADEYNLSSQQSQIFITRFSEKYQDYKETEFYETLPTTLNITKENYTRQLTEIYRKFTPNRTSPRGCTDLTNCRREKFLVFLAWLQEQYSLENPQTTPLPVNNSDSNQSDSRTQSIDEYEFDWHYICSQISVTNASRAIHNLGRSKVPPMSMTLQPELKDSHQENTKYEDEEFFELVLNSGKQQNRIILSESSVGKSLFLAKFASYLHNNQKGYPLYISTSEFKQKSLLNYLFQNWLEDSLHYIPNQVEVSPELKNQFISLLENQQVYLLLDIDKFVNHPKQVILSVLESKSNSFLQKTNIILACKPQVFQTCQHYFDDWQSQDFDTYNILPLNEQQVQEFIQKRFTREPHLGELLQKRLSEVQDRRIAQLTQNPSYLVRLCDNWSVKQNRLTEEPKRLYERFQNNYSYWKFLILGN